MCTAIEVCWPPPDLLATAGSGTSEPVPRHWPLLARSVLPDNTKPDANAEMVKRMLLPGT
jgi:hypothetical protein